MATRTSALGTATGACVFCQVLLGQTAAAFVDRGPGWAAFLDKKPLFRGHVLVVPELHRETLLDLDDHETQVVFAAVRRITRAVVAALGCGGTFIAVNNKVSQSVPHLHVHVVPRTKGDGLRGFFWPRTHYATDAEIEDTRSRIARAVEAT